MSRIFISYKRVDKEKVFKIKEQIESALGEKCWIDLDGIESDAQFMNVIIKAIRECEVLLFMYSKTHAQITDFEKDWTVRELNFASKKVKRIVFVNIDGSPLSDEFEFMYGTKQQVDALSENAMNKLCADLRTWLNISTVQPNYAKNTVSSLPSLKSQNDDLIFIVGNVEFKMIRVEGGSFIMGNSSESASVTLSPYYIGETQVSMALWNAVMGTHPILNEIADDVAVNFLNYYDCTDFIRKLNQKTSRNFRLLTESEWEFAARGGNKSKGYTYAGSNIIDEVAWYEHNSGPRPIPLGIKCKQPNELNLFDMCGNVWEWCADRIYENDIYYKVKPPKNMFGLGRVCRGGSYIDEENNCRIFSRLFEKPFERKNNIGLRLALSE